MSVPILGVDPGFASIGYTVATLNREGPETPILMGVFRTDKSNAKKNVLASDDNVRRAREISEFLRGLLRNQPYGQIRAICAETMSFPRSASVAAKMAMCWGVLAALSEEYDIPVLQATPQDLKKHVTGVKTASKEDIQRALDKEFGVKVLKGLTSEVTGSLLEHPYDALGAIVACRDSEVLRLARRMST